MIKLKNKKVIVTGGMGFLGSFICENLESKGAIAIPVKSQEVNILNPESLIQFMAACKPDYCIHAAGYNGGIEFNRMYPADIFYANTIMGLNVHYACQYIGIKKLLSIMTSCAYPDTGMEVLKEETFWEGSPNKTIRAHGIAKRTLQTASEAYNDQYELNAATVCVTNLYGPKDTFNLVRTKVVGALIRKFVEALDNNESVECWGTGSPMREFMYVEDAAEAIVQALQRYDDSTQPLNIGTGQDISIKELVEYIIKATEFKGSVNWNTDKPDGQMKKLLDVTRMSNYVDIKPTNIEEGIKKTVDWYRGNKKYADSRR